MPHGHGQGAGCCLWILKICRCFGSEDEASEPTPRARREQQLDHYDPPAPSNSGASAQQMRPAPAYADEADAGPLLPKTTESSAPLPRPGHSRNNSAASSAAAAAATAVGGSASDPHASHSSHTSHASKRPGSGHLSDATRAAVAGASAGTGLESGRGSHRRTASQGDAKQRHQRKASADAAAASAAAAAAHSAQLPSTAAGRPGTVCGPMQDEEDDFCPTCLDPYSAENPKIFTECGHHFHMPCIYAWLERKTTCPMCESPMNAPGLT
ncbi:hypothetical protein HYH03_016537 [Edaphochlamys debaryana]|uniref:RING-type E3 ubiquitin transferase n=1 Tax=Edaphochlamys debaryana TaxID=47281 RepID=A0A835XJQ7_9CHLO|nr:hypothetical protein HYH03_016537 [Edaphochlamys debaryana]|eukprot:KAG2484709.1 hypothetical protein HYH03_016537 [Edaphochlamys debaryana]